MRERADFEIPGLTFQVRSTLFNLPQFCTETTVFYKSEEMFALDENLGDIHSMIVGKLTLSL